MDRSLADGATRGARIRPIGLEGGSGAVMIGVMRFFLLLVFLTAVPFAGAQVATPDKSPAESLPEVRKLDGEVPEGAVVVIPLKGEVSKAQFFFLRRVIKGARRPMPRPTSSIWIPRAGSWARRWKFCRR